MWLIKVHTSQEAPTSTSGSSSLYKVSRDDLIGKKILNVNEKYYIVDHGIREAILESNQRDVKLLKIAIKNYQIVRIIKSKRKK